ncbi:unnamed protein product [Lactuca saligna]|uniref:Uncharacterized protein n=1 Tax=Lactuca saligna TaxID=75948 RepID=A0AA35ZV83_LACSI|nr:unnamed protein product [Lactuca saligna]
MISSRPKRSQTLPPVLRYPFVVRAVEIDSNLMKEENIQSNWLFSLCGNPRDDLFHSINGQRGERYMFESLYPREFLFSRTIDCSVEVLNYDERASNLDTPSCFFFKTAILDPAYMHSEACGPLAQWTCEFKMESVEQILQLRNLRKRYSMKILLSEVNLMKSEVEQLLVDYQKLSANDRRVMYHEGIINIAGWLAAFGT